MWSCRKVCDALHYLLDKIFIRIGSKLYRQIVGIPMGPKCAPLVAELFLFCYERDFLLSLSDNYQTDVVEAFNSTLRYLDDLLNIDMPYFEQMVSKIYPSELQLNKANPSSDTDASNFEIVNFPCLDEDIPRSQSYGVYISQLICFTKVCSHVQLQQEKHIFDILVTETRLSTIS